MKKIFLIVITFSSLFYIKLNSQTEKPNVLFIFADDQRADALGCVGNLYIKTLNTDNLAQNRGQFINT